MPEWFRSIIQKEVELFKRCYRLFIQPKLECEAIFHESPTRSTLFKDSLLFIAAVPAIARLLSWGIINFGNALINALIWYVLIVGVVWGIARLINLIAPSFDSDTDEDKAFTLIFYSFLPFLAAGLLYMVPLLTFIVPIIGLYGVYILWLGLPIFSKTPEKQRVLYTVIIAVVQIAAVLIVSRLTGGLVLSF